MLVWPIGAPDKHGQAALAELEPEQRQQVEGSAVDYLHRWTAGIYGLRDGSIRPCWAVSTLPPSTTRRRGRSGGWSPVALGGRWRTLACHLCGVVCSCSERAGIRFGFRVHTINHVTIDGVVMSPSGWRLAGHRSLYRVDGEDWPITQDLSLPDTEPGTWSIDLTYGTPVPEGGKLAAGMLAAEMAKALLRDGSCVLPQRLQTITRQGVTMTMIDSMETVTEGRTGIWLVDAWVASVMNAPTGGGVRSVDIPPTHWGR